MDQSDPARQGVKPFALQVVRLALLGGVLVIGGAGWYLRARNPELGVDPALAEGLRTAMRIVLVTGLFGLLLMRQRWSAWPGFAHRFRWTLAGWILADGVAVLSAVYFILTGGLLYLALGIVLMLVAFVLLPVPKP